MLRHLYLCICFLILVLPGAATGQDRFGDWRPYKQTQTMKRLGLSVDFREKVVWDSISWESQVRLTLDPKAQKQIDFLQGYLKNQCYDGAKAAFPYFSMELGKPLRPGESQVFDFTLCFRNKAKGRERERPNVAPFDLFFTSIRQSPAAVSSGSTGGATRPPAGSAVKARELAAPRIQAPYEIVLDNKCGKDLLFAAVYFEAANKRWSSYMETVKLFKIPKGRAYRVDFQRPRNSAVAVGDHYYLYYRTADGRFQSAGSQQFAISGDGARRFAKVAAKPRKYKGKRAAVQHLKCR